MMDRRTTELLRKVLGGVAVVGVAIGCRLRDAAMKLMLSLLVLTFSFISAYTQAVHIDSIVIVDCGTYTAQTEDHITAPAPQRVGGTL